MRKTGTDRSFEYLAKITPCYFQIHYGQYRREDLFEAGRRSRSCAYLADNPAGYLIYAFLFAKMEIMKVEAIWAPRRKSTDD
jgi:hypothetical protein